jgi:hypothetical protein
VISIIYLLLFPGRGVNTLNATRNLFTATATGDYYGYLIYPAQRSVANIDIDEH